MSNAVSGSGDNSHHSAVSVGSDNAVSASGDNSHHSAVSVGSDNAVSASGDNSHHSAVSVGSDNAIVQSLNEAVCDGLSGADGAVFWRWCEAGGSSGHH